MDEYLSRKASVDESYLSDWYISSVGDDSPVWTDEHIDELLNDFIVIPKDTPDVDVHPVKHGKDVMKVLQQVSDTCERTGMCMECEFYSKNSGMCVFADMPIFWKHEEIEKALRDGDADA